jgi:ABC-2 type transporter
MSPSVAARRGLSLRRIRTIATLHGLDIVRRPITLILLAILPALIYFALGDDPYAVVVGGILMAFSVAGPAIFVLLTGRPIDSRLTLSGFKPAELVLGRLLLLNTLGLGVISIFATLVITQSHPEKPFYVLLGTILVAFIAVPLGLCLASLMPGDLEATLLMVGVVGIQVALKEPAPLSKFLPFHGPRQLLLGSGGKVLNGVPLNVDVTTAIIHGTVMSILFFVLATFAVSRRSRIHPAAPPPSRKS